MNRTEIVCVVFVLIIAAIAVTACAILNQNGDDEKSVKDCMDSVVEIKCESSGEKSYGTGFIIDQDGPKVITCAHVVTHTVTDKKQSHDSIQCSFYNSDESHQLNMICFDSEKDIAVLSFESQPDKVSCIAFSEDNTDYGDKAYVIGNSMNYGLSVKDGLVSVPKLTVVKDNAKRDCIMISVSINSGDSGAPIIDSDNRVIGMVSFRLRDSGTTIQGMGYGVLTSDIVSYLYNVADTH